MRISIEKEMTGEILDIGGGGEGIIGRVYGQQVTAIDNIQEELDEAPSSCKKMLMDASELEFSDETAAAHSVRNNQARCIAESGDVCGALQRNGAFA